MSYVCITGISNLVTDNNLHELFVCCGTIKELKVVNVEQQKKCVICFEDAGASETAIMISGTELGDEKLDVKTITKEEADKLMQFKPTSKKALTEYEKAVEKMQKYMEGPKNQSRMFPDEIATRVQRTVYVGNLPRNCTGQQVRELFSTVGEILYVKFSGTAQYSYAFIEFMNDESARAAFTLQGTKLGGQTIKIGQAHNPIFKDDITIGSDSHYAVKEARRHAQRLGSRFGKKEEESPKKRSRSRSKERKRRSRRERRRRRRRRSPSQSSPEPEMYFDGWQWHTNKEKKTDDWNTSSIVSQQTAEPVEYVENKPDPIKTIQDEAAKALQHLKRTRFGV